MIFYKLKELQNNTNYLLAKQKARRVWDQKAIEKYNAVGDRGACTIGGGIYIFAVPPRCRKPKRLLVLDTPSIAQGEVVKYAGITDARDIFKSYGFEVICDYGRLD